ncbi:GGDEF domain-containing protein [Paracidobacterium acidisoli]|nr:GGDEF domain-containing protein [Paracidobacterium acidisoli]MBT9330465.1 GGDEF domain-containing protein [Paracidobacterium acidisoli]
MAGYAVILAMFVIGCFAIDRSMPNLKGMRWLKSAFALAFAGIVLFSARSYTHLFFIVSLTNLSLVMTYVLLHQAICEVLERPNHQIRISMAVVVFNILACVDFTLVHPNFSYFSYAFSTTAAVQIALSAYVLFRHYPPLLRGPAMFAGGIMATLASIHVVRAIVTIFLGPPHTDLTHPYLFQSFFTLVHCMLGISAGLSFVWLSVCAQRLNLQTLALTDGLTGLLNRRAFEEALQRELTYSNRHGKALGLVLVDLDFFKIINDTYGHPIGDEVIRRVSAVLQCTTRGSDALARFGGEEFTMLLRDTDSMQAAMVAERIRHSIEMMDNLPVSLNITASVGVAVSTFGDTSETLLKHSDEALYRSKRAGRNMVSIHSDSTLERVYLPAPQSRHAFLSPHR